MVIGCYSVFYKPQLSCHYTGLSDGAIFVITVREGFIMIAHALTEQRERHGVQF